MNISFAFSASFFGREDQKGWKSPGGRESPASKSWKHIWGRPLSIWLSSKSSFADHSSDSLLHCESLSFVSRHLLSCQLYPSESWHRLCGKCLGSQPTSSQSSSTYMSREAKQSRRWVFHRVSQSVPSQIKQFCLYLRVSIEKLFPK